jgi:HAD superfamily hydrolase (TIGR01490 family)
LFDMDDTLVRANTAGMFFRARWQDRALNYRQLLTIGWVLLRYRLSVIDMTALIHDAAGQAEGSVEAEMQALCRSLYETKVRPCICPHAAAALRAHQAQGDVVAIVTASTPYIARLLAADLGIQHVLCTDLEVADGRFTGRLVGEPCYGAGKVLRAQALATEQSLSLQDAWFYTDSHSDWPLLAAVGHPCAVRPDPRLRWLAWRRGWPVMPW